MARLKKFKAFRTVKRAYTRTSKYRKKAYIKSGYNIRIVRFHNGNPKKEFPLKLSLQTKSELNIRDNALESARQTSNRLLERELGKIGYHLHIKVYPHHVIREHALATGAGADRFSSGMKHAFGKPIGRSARLRKGQTVFEVGVAKSDEAIARKALERASKKLPCKFAIVKEIIA